MAKKDSSDLTASVFEAANSVWKSKGVHQSIWPAPYDKDTLESLIAFLHDVIVTWNESNSCTEPFPKDCWPYVDFVARVWFDCRRDGTTMMVEKSRRIFFSWIIAAVTLWAMGLRQENRRIAGIDYKKAAKHVWRLALLYEEIKERNPRWKLGPLTTYGSVAGQEVTRVILPNGSLCEYLNQQSQNLQGEGCTGVTLEELSHYDRPGEIISQAAKVTQGKGGTKGGHVVAISNPSPKRAWQEIKELDEHGYHRTEDMPEGLWIGKCKRGYTYLRVHYTCDPSKRSAAWIEEERRPIGSKEWDSDYELREDVYHSGEPVFSDYKDHIHCPESIRYDKLPVVQGSQFFGGWDIGNTTLEPAFVLVQLTPKHQIHVLLEITSPGSESMEVFAPRVFQYLALEYPEVYWDIKHYADATVMNRNGVTGQTAADIARQHGIIIRPSPNGWAQRFRAVTWLVNSFIKQPTDDTSTWVPRLYVCGKTCPTLREGFKGAYRFQEAPRSGAGPERMLMPPLKNGYSHIQDALQAVMVQIHRLIVEGPEQVRTRRSEEAA